MDGDRSGQDSFVGLPLRPAPRLRWRRVSRHRIGPLRTVAEAAGHPVLHGIRSGAVTGLVIVALLGLPVLLILGAKAPTPSEPPARVRATTPQAATPVRVWAESPGVPPRAPIPIALAEPVPPRAEPPRDRGVEVRPVLSLDLIPVLDDESGALSVEDPPLPIVKPGRPNRIPAPARAARTP